MCGTAAEVTPLRSIDDHELGRRADHARDPGGVPRHGPRRDRPLGAVARVRPAARAHRLSRARREHDDAADSALLALDRRARRGARARGAALGAGSRSARPAPASRSCSREAAGAPHAPRSRSGTAGLHLCMRLAGVGPGDEVITSPYSFVASANCAIYEGATPVFADIDPRTYNLDPAAVEAAITARTKAIVAVDIFGYPCRIRRAAGDLRAARARARRGLVRGARRTRTRARPLGSHGHPAVFAFYPNKQMTTGEGGAVTTGSAEEHELLVSLRNQGRLETSSWLQHGRLGFNYRLDDLSAALGIGQLEKLDRILEARREVARALRRAPRRRRRRDAARRRRRPRALVVRLRRQAPARRRPRRRRAAPRSPTASHARRTCRRSTCSPTCGSGSGSPRASAR